ncbi:hypothetical protein SAY87_025663 [Trapa incisa]|uniref:Phospholipase-like protein n=1 Tax=Trapa incisa TaxID=236973 RepID=A0AAN7GLU5_9MYRT|nr:hypothetical protein SAY87_025663 [Trapa incisa]
MADVRRLHPDCPNASNPYHECFDECYRKIASGEPVKSNKKSGHGSGRKVTAKRRSGDSRTDHSCPKASNPYHECRVYCFQDGPHMETRASRKQSADETPISRRKNREPNPQSKPTAEVLRKEAKGTISSAGDARSSRSQIPSMDSGELRPEEFSFDKEPVRSSYSIMPSGNPAPDIGLLPDRRTLRDHLSDNFAMAASSKVSKLDKEDQDSHNYYFSGEIVCGKVADNENRQVAGEANRGSMSSCITDNSCSFRNCIDDEAYTDDSQSAASEARVPVGKYHVKSSVSSILQAILEKHGDIAENCRLESIAMRSYYLECVCFVVQELQSISFTTLTESKVNETLAIVKDLESSHIEVKWLREIIDKLSEVTEFVSKHETVKAAKVESDQAVEGAMRELDLQSKALAVKEQEVLELKAVVAEVEQRLRELENEASQLYKAVSSVRSHIDSFQLGSLLQELV